MTLPRPVLPGQSYMVTRRCSQRQFLMRPDRETNQAFEYCLAVAAEKFGIQLLFTVAMSNHHHTGIFDPDARYPEFLAYFHKLFAKCQNALRGRWENFWSSEQTSMVLLDSPQDVLDKLVYAVTNPVKEQLVEKALEWPGVCSYESHCSGKEKVVKRPKHFFREKGGPMPEEVILRFQRPAGFEHLSQKEWAEQIRMKVREVERGAAGERRTQGKVVLGKNKILAQRWDSRPAHPEPRRQLNPRIAAKSVWRRIEALKRNQRFLKAYQAARAVLAAGYNFAVFPDGTYWMKRFMSVVCETQPCELLLTG